MVELFSGSHEGETFADDQDAGVIWAPILRSGQHAMRPGPGGTKLRIPLKIVAGKSSDPSKEIGLMNLKESFDKGAVQHVTIPKGHPKDDEEMMLKNTGYIKALKIVESKKKPGEMVLMGAHEFRDTDVKDRIQKGLIANRSCGILYNHVNTETGETFEQALEHVALTQKPWIRGMASYGTDSAVDLSEVERYSFEMYDDEDGIDEPLSLADADLKQTKTGTVGVVVPDKLELDVQVVWDPEQGMMNQRSQIDTILRGMKKSTAGVDSYGPPYYDVKDIMPGKALITCDYGYSEGIDAWVVPFSTDDDGEVTLEPFGSWTAADQAWIADTDADSDPDDDPATGLNAPPSGTNMADDDEARFAAAVRSRLQLSQEHNPTPSTGGIPMLNLSEESLAKLTPQEREQYQRAKDQIELAERNARTAAVKTKIDELKAKGYDAAPALLLTAERFYKSDQGDPAVMLLSDSGEKLGSKTATEIVDELLGSLPMKDGKVQFGEVPNVLESPLDGRPDATTEQQRSAEEQEGTKLSVEEQANAMLLWLGEHAPGAAQSIANNGNGAK